MSKTGERVGRFQEKRKIISKVMYLIVYFKDNYKKYEK